MSFSYLVLVKNANLKKLMFSIKNLVEILAMLCT